MRILAIVFPLLLYGAASAQTWETYRSTGGYAVARGTLSEEGRAVLFACNSEVPDVYIRLTVPFAETNLPEDLWDELAEGNIYTHLGFFELDGGSGLPFQLFTRGFVIADKDKTYDLTLRVSDGFGFRMYPGDAALAAAHLVAAHPTLTFSFGQSVDYTVVLAALEYDLSSGREAFGWAIEEGCPDLADWTGGRPAPEGLLEPEFRTIQWYDFESTRFSAAQREAFEASARTVLGKNARAIICSYRQDSGGTRTYDFWYRWRPAGVDTLIRRSGRNDSRGAQLGQRAVNECPENEDIARLLKFRG